MVERIIFADKPAGVTTHSSLNEKDRKSPVTDVRDGFVEHLEDRLGLGRLFVNHRLDRETTGAISFARDAETAARLQELFSSRQVKKQYLFISDRSSQGRDSELEISSFIERRGSRFVSSDPSTDQQAPNAVTRMRLLARDHGVELWQAEPQTGRPHQIRLHAERAGLAILGDVEHGGSSFPALCLHSAEIRFSLAGEEYTHHSPAPIWFSRRDLIADHEMIRWLAAIDRRERLVRSKALIGDAEADSVPPTLRWLHTEADPLRGEQLGEVLALSWFDDRDPSDMDLARVRTLCTLKGWSKWYLQVRGNRGRSPNAESKVTGDMPIPERWLGQEHGLKFEFRLESGLSPGLFLDQRQNRAWVRANAGDKSVLNLFCYTGGFSVAAAAGGATKVVSVDLSKSFLEWSKTNFLLNGLPLDGHEFRSIDSREYLAWAAKKGLVFDLVICDPPSFGRSRAGVFSINKEFPSLLEALFAVTAPGGSILFSSNYENWSLDEFERRALQVMKKNNWRARLASSPSPDWDFELPLNPRNMKSFFLVRI
jgi:23S rRNA (cytosine1962-C5)-methyltransferase